jgi:hypothetical protein
MSPPPRRAERESKTPTLAPPPPLTLTLTLTPTPPLTLTPTPTPPLTLTPTPTPIQLSNVSTVGDYGVVARSACQVSRRARPGQGRYAPLLAQRCSAA